MNKLFAKTIDYYALCNIHKVKSKNPHYHDNQKTTYDFKEFWNEPTLPDIKYIKESSSGHYEAGRYQFKSLIATEHEDNNLCYGAYQINKASTNGSVSAIIVHGWRSSNNTHLKDIYLDAFMKKGYNTFTYTLPYHFERTPGDSYNGEYLVTANIQRTLDAVRQSVMDIRALILHLKQQNHKVILIGNSLGGLITNMTAVLEENIDILISLFYANNLAFSVWNSIPGKYVKRDFLKNSNITYEQLQKKWDFIIPSNHKAAMLKDNILLVSGKHDLFVLEEDTKKLWKSWDNPKRLLYDCGHAGIVLNKKAILNDSMDFINGRI